MKAYNSTIVKREKIITSITRELGYNLKKYLEEEIGVGTFNWYWGEDDPACRNANGQIVIKFPTVMLSSPEIDNFRLLQEYEPVIKDIDRENLVAKSFYPSKPVMLSYDLRIMIKNPDDEESLMLALERVQAEMNVIYPLVCKEPEIRYRCAIWWRQGKSYSYDTDMTTTVYPIDVITNIESRRFKKVRLISPSNNVVYTTRSLRDSFDLQEFRLMHDAPMGSTVVYIDRCFKGLPSEGFLFLDDCEEEIKFISRKQNELFLEKPLESYQLAGTRVLIKRGR